MKAMENSSQVMEYPSEWQILDAANALKNGELVAFPTETVYGLGADASNNQALARLYKAKGRPESHPVIVHIATVDGLSNWAVDIPPEAYNLAECFWPGPMTLILKRASGVSDRVTGGQATIGIRIPSHPVALELLEKFGGGIAAPSANKFGRISATMAGDVRREFGNEVAFVLDGGLCQVGIESTIVDLTGVLPRILRPGMITPRQVADVVGKDVLGADGQILAIAAADCNREEVQQDESRQKSEQNQDVNHQNRETNRKGQNTIRVPGSMKSHYAPRTPLRLLSSAELMTEIGKAAESGRRIAVLSLQAKPLSQPATNDEASGETPWIVAPDDPQAYARQLYSSLRKLDQASAHFIFVEAPPLSESWLGIIDRLKRAAH